LRLEINRFPYYDCIICMGCGSGVQAMSALVDKPVFPSNDTVHSAMTKRIGHFENVCIQCGECIIGNYGGICPVARCAKSLLNGPCGGSENGKCETDPEKDCAWQLIYDRLKKQDRLDILKKYIEPK